MHDMPDRALTPHVRAKQQVALLPRQVIERRDRATVVQIRVVGRRSAKIFLIGDRKRLEAEHAVVLDDDDARPERFNRFPNPVFVTVNVNRKQAKVS